MQQHLTPWMVKSAYGYLKAAKHLRAGHDMLDIAQINAEIGMEILPEKLFIEAQWQARQG
jgi:hypothetical protein